MKQFQRIFAVVLFALIPVIAFAVTDKEMEQARALATKYYLRYVNNGSDYLDKEKPATVAELEKVLKEKEKKNIQAFKKIKTPADYKSWDKAKLVEFWSVTALNTPGLEPKGKEAQWQIKKAINAMTIGAPAKEEPKKEEPKKEEVKKEEKPAEPVEQPAQVIVAQESAQPAGVAEPLVSEAEMKAIEEMADEEEMPVKKEGSYTWVYILALAVLVAAVIGLVVFATNLLSKDSARGGNHNYSDRGRDRSEEEENLLETIDEKNSEIAMLAKKLESANRQNAELKQKLEALAVEVSALRTQAGRHSRGGDQSARQEMQHSEPVETRSLQQDQPRADHDPGAHNAVRSIYLGRANSKGIFIRADRKLNPGNSIFRLDTRDGISGTFIVAKSPEVWDVALKLPREYLSFACIGPDLGDTSGMTRIINDTPGTAVFEGGCWRVTRKARIHYE